MCIIDAATYLSVSRDKSDDEDQTHKFYSTTFTNITR